jgi:hypothetical protein
MYKGFPAIDLTKWGHPQVPIIPIPGSVLHNVAPLPRLDKREEARVVHPGCNILHQLGTIGIPMTHWKEWDYNGICKPSTKWCGAGILPFR